MKLARSIWPGFFFALRPRAGFGGYTSFEVCAVFARHTPGWIRAGLPGMGGSAFQSGTLGGVPSLPSVLDFLAAKWLQEADLNRRYTAYEAAVLPLHHPAMCQGLTVPRRYKIGDMPPSGVGADSGNRTHVFGSEGRRSAVELHPRVPPKGRVKGDICRRSFPAIR